MSRYRGLFFAFAAYIAVAVIFFYHRNLLAGTAYLSDGGTDASLYIWMFRFLPAAIAHLQNPFVLGQAWAPFGLNITQATTTPLLALLAWPITAITGPVISYNIVAMTAPAFAALACFAFAGSYTKSWSVAFMAGWIFGFSTAVFGPMLGHLQTSFIAFLPLAFLAVRKRAESDISLRQFSIALFLVLAGEFLVSLEGFVTEAIFLLLFTAATQATLPGGIGRLVRLQRDNLVLELIAVYGAVVIAMSPFIYSFFRDYRDIPHVLQTGGNSVIDLLNFVIPTPITWLGGDLARPISQIYAPNLSEANGYLGLPLILLSLGSAWRLRRQKAAWPLFVLLGVGFLLVLGPHLHVLGRLTTIQLPWGLLERLPFLSNALPSRLMPFVLLAISAICAMYIDRLASVHRAIALAAIVIAAISTLPATFVHPTIWDAPLPTSQFISTGAYRKIISPGENVLFLPFNYGGGDAMFWQTEADGYFRMANGYGNFVPFGLGGWPAATMLQAGTPGLDFPRQFNLFMHGNGIDAVILPTSMLPVWNAALQRSHWVARNVADFTVFTKAPGQPIAGPQISSADARYMFETQHFSALRAAASCLLAKGTRQVTMAAAAAALCLSPDIAPKAEDPFGNWDRDGGWLGIYGPGIGVGVLTDPVTAARIASDTSADAQTIYYPYPRLFRRGADPARLPRAPAQLLEVFPQATFSRTN